MEDKFYGQVIILGKVISAQNSIILPIIILHFFILIMGKKQSRENFIKKKKLHSRIQKRKRKKEKYEPTQQIREGQSIFQSNQEELAEFQEAVMSGRHLQQFKSIFLRNEQNARKKYMQQTIDSDQQSNQEQLEQQQGTSINQPRPSRKNRKMLRWLKVAHLKALASRPDLVEAWDITAYDPLFLVHLKSVKNSVAVPRHWNQKSKFLQTKRGILKAPFKLPEYIESTGISKLRDPFTESGGKMIRQKLRERMNPRLGKIDIDYNVLHDAFFKFQTKPHMTGYGDIYYQGKEDQAKAKNFRPGYVSAELRHALGIGQHQAPPWLINMQRFGPPPSYPTLRLLGSNPSLSQINSYSMLSKAHLEQASRKSGISGLYASFRGFEQQEQGERVQKGYWGQIQQQQQQQSIPQPEQP